LRVPAVISTRVISVVPSISTSVRAIVIASVSGTPTTGPVVIPPSTPTSLSIVLAGDQTREASARDLRQDRKKNGK